ncbi:hypothetical protein IEO21_04762 [Rhodonia placenta]|uniref:Uncharacterized protein n=1 Tax=Rhodonia placenta TaxID=104341 RepID=A0A8H7P3P9_9APHY|nr:hypothetical protein IEO21_04762 [Postia placenta]
MFASAVLSLAFAASALAVPALQARQSGPCAGFGAGSTATPTYNFTLTAVPSGAGANATGTPLVLGWGPAGDSPAASEWVLSTEASWGENEWPYITLQDGALLPQPGTDEHGLGAYNFGTDTGDEVLFTIIGEEASPSTLNAVMLMCEVQLVSGSYVELAVNGDAGNFALCNATTTWVSNQVNLVYAPNADSGDYTYETCTPVRVELIPYDG